MTDKDMPAEWAVINDYAFTPIKVERETAATVFYLRGGKHERRTQSAFAWRGSEEDARALSAKLKTAQGEKQRRVRDANTWFRKRVEELTLAKESSHD